MVGTYLPDLDANMTMFLLSTGTGVGSAYDHAGDAVDACKQVLMMECVRYSGELAYASQIRAYADSHRISPHHPGYARGVGESDTSGLFFQDNVFRINLHGVSISSEHTHVFAGNPR